MDDKQLALFDYGTLDLDTRSFVQTKTAEIKNLLNLYSKSHCENSYLVKIAFLLEFTGSMISIKIHNQTLALKWAENVYKQFGSTVTVTPELTLKTIFLLSAPSTPEPARSEALSLAESGEKITHAKAQELVAKYKAEAEAAKQDASEAKKELASRQQLLFDQEERIKYQSAKLQELETERSSLEQERTRLRSELD